MATLTPSLTLTSTDATSDTLSFTVTDTLTVTDPSTGLSRLTITTADDQELVDEDTSGIFYFYAKNIDTTNFVILQTTGSVQYARLSPGEFCFFPVNDGNGLEARADTASCILEYAYWKKG
jgi:hypothetical protein|tara:strand:- start:1007 stop:1369 length:363 start_codon:yes stop_codon:yes gene_type:complete